ncbi:MAG: hypothetical protein ACOYEW_03165 [Anaerolineae bacterium]|jgi:hypothetical protein
MSQPQGCAKQTPDREVDQPSRPQLKGKRVERTEDGRYVVYYTFDEAPAGQEERP